MGPSLAAAGISLDEMRGATELFVNGERVAQGSGAEAPLGGPAEAPGLLPAPDPALALGPGPGPSPSLSHGSNHSPYPDPQSDPEPNRHCDLNPSRALKARAYSVLHQALAWLANHLNSRGLALAKGHFVATGQTCNTKGCKPGDRVVATFAGLGRVEMVVAP